MLTSRLAKLSDKSRIFDLYKRVSMNIGGIARTKDEITEDYISVNLKNSMNTGVSLVIENEDATKIIAEIHCYKVIPKVFSHILSELTIVVDADYQKRGLGRLLFKNLLAIVEEERNDILRIELIARESNLKAIQFYKNLGFKIEGRFENRIHNLNNSFEADIPMAWFNKNYKK